MRGCNKRTLFFDHNVWATLLLSSTIQTVGVPVISVSNLLNCSCLNKQLQHTNLLHSRTRMMRTMHSAMMHANTITQPKHNTMDGGDITCKTTSSSGVAKRSCDASCLSVVSFNSTKCGLESFIVSYVGYRFITAYN